MASDNSDNDDILKRDLLTPNGHRSSFPQRPASVPKPARFRNQEAIPTRTENLNPGTHRIVVGIDYGTTFTGVSYTTASANGGSLRVNTIEVITDWGTLQEQSQKIPSVISYSPTRNKEELQWGYSINEESRTMMNTKLELDVQDNMSDELESILQALDGMHNLDFAQVKKSKGIVGNENSTWKKPEEVAKDYMTKVYGTFVRQVLNCKEYKDYRDTIPIDIVVTVPVGWSYRAKNSTYRAVTQAGFGKLPSLNEILLITEPEAAAMFTARFLQQERHDIDGGNFLEEEECFVLCDAGGGTVDCVSYEVVQLTPTLQLKQVGPSQSAKCGSSFIDLEFKYFLLDLLGPDGYKIIDKSGVDHRGKINNNSESQEMRKLMKQFDTRKKSFESAEIRDFLLQLPEGLRHVHVDGKIENGKLIITGEDMKSFFDPFVDQIVELIQAQITQVDEEQKQVLNCFLVGGFAESDHLRSEIECSLEMRDIVLRVPSTDVNQTAWTAVVRGAALYGAEKESYHNVQKMYRCPKNYGFEIGDIYEDGQRRPSARRSDKRSKRSMTGGPMTWPFLKGDLILSTEAKVEERECYFRFEENGSRNFSLKMYEWPRDNRPPKRLEYQREMRHVFDLRCDMSSQDLGKFDRYENRGAPYYMVTLLCRMTMTATEFTAEIIWGDECLDKKSESFSRPNRVDRDSDKSNNSSSPSSPQGETPSSATTAKQGASTIPEYTAPPNGIPELQARQEHAANSNPTPTQNPPSNHDSSPQTKFNPLPDSGSSPPSTQQITQEQQYRSLLPPALSSSEVAYNQGQRAPNRQANSGNTFVANTQQRQPIPLSTTNYRVGVDYQDDQVYKPYRPQPRNPYLPDQNTASQTNTFSKPPAPARSAAAVRTPGSSAAHMRELMQSARQARREREGDERSRHVERGV